MQPESEKLALLRTVQKTRLVSDLCVFLHAAVGDEFTILSPSGVAKCRGPLKKCSWQKDMFYVDGGWNNAFHFSPRIVEGVTINSLTIW